MPEEKSGPSAEPDKCPRCGHYPWKIGTFPGGEDCCGFHGCGCKHAAHSTPPAPDLELVAEKWQGDQWRGAVAETPQPFPVCEKCGQKVTTDWEVHEENCGAQPSDERAALEKYGNHLPGCKIPPYGMGNRYFDAECTCGFTEALRAARASQERKP